MKKLTKICSLALTGLMLCSGFVACKGPANDSNGRDDLTDEQKASRTELKVGIYEGGLGKDWIYDFMTAFEEKYKDVSFEAGKKGIYISPESKKDGYSTLITDITYNRAKQDVYINTGVSFEEYVEKGVALDMTKYVKANVYDANGEVVISGTKGAEVTAGGGTQSIMDRLNPYFLKIDNFGTESNPVFYSLPYEWCLHGFIYDYDLLKNENLLKYDGLDGTPETVDEYFELLDALSLKGISTFVCSMSEARWYWNDLQYGFVAQYEGEDRALLNLTFDGEATFSDGTFTADECEAEGVLTRTNAKGEKEQYVTITEENAWMLSRQAGKTEYIKFLRKLMSTKYADDSLFGGGLGYRKAQHDFLASANKSEGRIAMLLDGEFWENEARPDFNELGMINKDFAYGKRDFRFMPIPQANGGKNEKPTFFVNGSGPCFINAKTTKADAAGAFVQYLYSNYGANLILKNTSMTLPIDFEILPEVESSITPFALNTYKLKTSDDVNIVMANANQLGVNEFAKYLIDEGNGSVNALIMSGYAGDSLKSKVPASDAQSDANKFVVSNDAPSYFFNNLNITAQKWNDGVKPFYNKTDWTKAWEAFNNK